MNKQELEKKFDEKVSCTGIYNEYKDEITDEVIQFITGTVIPEVIKSITDVDYSNYDRNSNCDNNFLLWIENVKQKAKEIYNIDL